MRQSRFFVPLDLQAGNSYEMPESVGHYMSRVLRLPIGAKVILFSGDNYEYSAEIAEIGKKHVSLKVLECQFRDRESPLSIHLIQAISKGEKMDWVFQKAVELGVSKLTPVTSSRTSFSLNESRADKKIQHWQGVVSSACEQCGRNRIPEVRNIIDFGKAISEFKNTSACRIILNPLGNQSLKDMQCNSAELILLVGPEGGFCDEEIALAEQHGFLSCSLGTRILRTETAAIAMLSLAQGLWGDLT